MRISERVKPMEPIRNLLVIAGCLGIGVQVCTLIFSTERTKRGFLLAILINTLVLVQQACFEFVYGVIRDLDVTDQPTQIFFLLLMLSTMLYVVNFGVNLLPKRR
ncbi:hypothetical protein [Lacticaseibacillus daqingensis]|uniref:hypothetical protein n=1 Tax=Lacticaseibacillus daqingensis TaxID=2486014 RepID=UPI000F7B0E3B|nr:hypothetical protein [Lacticaseibacillus daqingensis]